MALAVETPSIEELAGAYISQREKFYKSGGKDFMNDKQKLRVDYCIADVSKAALAHYAADLPSASARLEFSRRFEEWDAKIAAGFLTKASPATLSETDFLRKADTLYKKYQSLLDGKPLEGFTIAKDNLRVALLPELGSDSSEIVAARHGIKDPEILLRMKFDWSWKS